MSFWTSPLGLEITGSEKDAFLPDFTVIPEGTMALGMVKSCQVIDAQPTQFKDAEKYIEVVYKLVDGEFKNQEVTHKIKVFQGKPEAIHRNLNMLKLLMMLCSFKPTHKGEPTNDDLRQLQGKVVGIKIGEWSMPRDDGAIAEGNFVREVHPSTGFVCETGVKAEVRHAPVPPPQAQSTGVESAFSRNPAGMAAQLDDDVPF